MYIINMKRELIKRDAIMGTIVSDSNRFSTDKGEISLVGPCRATFYTFEIYCINGDLFDDIERYDTLEEAEDRIKEMLL
jgi:hypothetical protein